MIVRDNPTLEYLKSIDKRIPAFIRVIEIVERELERNNEILDIGDGATMSDETNLIIRFQNVASEQYEGVQDFGKTYQCITFCDNNGATSIWFPKQ